MNILIIIALSLLTLISGLITWLGISGPVILGVVTLLWGYFTHFESVSVGQVIVVWVVAGGLELVEFFLGGLAARNYGASSRSMWLAILGGILGTIIGAGLFVFIGALVGLLAGSYLGAYIGELSLGRSETEAAHAAMGALLGNVAGKALKMVATFVMGIWLIQQVV